MIRSVCKIVGLIVLIAALVLKLTESPLYIWHMDDSKIWQTEQDLPFELGSWHGKKFEFASWVYNYIPSDFLSGRRYHKAGQQGEMIEVSLIHSEIRDYLHDPDLCSYAQGVEQKLLQTVAIPGSNVKASFAEMMITETGERFYQLSWYQWGMEQSSPNFWSWMPVSLSWPLFHKKMPKWHYYTLVYVNLNHNQAVLENKAREKLLEFALLLQKSLKGSI